MCKYLFFCSLWIIHALMKKIIFCQCLMFFFECGDEYQERKYVGRGVDSAVKYTTNSFVLIKYDYKVNGISPNISPTLITEIIGMSEGGGGGFPNFQQKCLQNIMVEDIKNVFFFRF